MHTVVRLPPSFFSLFLFIYFCGCNGQKSDHVQDGDTCHSSSNPLRVIRAPLRSPHHIRPSQGLLHSEALSVLKASTSKLRTWISNNRSSLISSDSYATLSSPMFITCNAPIAWTIMDSERFSCMQSQPTSAGDHDRYNKSACVNRVVAGILLVPICLRADYHSQV